MSTRVEGSSEIILVTAHATLTADLVRLVLFVREGPVPGTWRYNLTNSQGRHASFGHIAGMRDHMDALRNAAGICALGAEPGSTERGLLEQFAEGPRETDRGGEGAQA